MASISFRKCSTKTNIRHNNRERIAPNVVPDRTPLNQTYCRKSIEDLYGELFSSAVQEYNQQQSRADRQITDYYHKTLHDKKTKEQQELIVAVGEAGELPEELCAEILDKYMQAFQMRNPHLAVYNAVLHRDEANPHLHINFVPYADYSKGLSRRVNFEKALQQQDCKDFAAWRDKETGVVEQLMLERGIERTEVGTHDLYLSPREYKDKAKVIEQSKNVLSAKIQPILDTLDKEPRNYPIEYKRGFNGKISVSEEQFKAVYQENIDLRKQNKALIAKNELLTVQNNTQEQDIKELHKSAYKGYWKDRTRFLHDLYKQVTEGYKKLQTKLTAALQKIGIMQHTLDRYEKAYGKLLPEKENAVAQYCKLVSAKNEQAREEEEEEEELEI